MRRRAKTNADILSLVLKTGGNGEQTELICLGDLVKCLPDDLWHATGKKKVVVGLVEPTRPTTEEDWVRFDHNAELVTHITWDKSASASVTSALYRWLLSARPGKELFPNLVAINLTHKEKKDEREVFLHLPVTSYRQATFAVEAESGPCPPNLIPSVLAYLRHASSCFTTDMYINLRCASATDMDAFQPSLVEALASLQNLRSLCLVANQAIIFENLKALASLPCLQKLKIENPFPDSDFVTNAPLTADNEPPPPAHVFRALQRLKLKPYRLRDAPVVLSSFAFPSLEALSVDTKANSQSKHVYRIMRLASMRCSHDKLTNIWVGGGEYGEEYAENEIGAITTASLGHLCAFPNLTHVVVFSEMCIVPNDSFMERFALACPHLVCLTFYSSCAPMDSDWLDPQATLRSLVYLVQHCPQLDSVGMGIDTSDVDTLSLPRKGCFNTRIQDIDVGKAPLRGDPARVGAFLFALFPKITDFTDQFTDSKPRTWKPVVKAIEKLRLQHPATDY